MNGFKAVVFDWAGTMVDFGSFAPTAVFVEAFRQFDIEVGIDEARAPMGLPKRDHLKAMLDQRRINKAWAAVHGKAPDDAAIDRLYEVFLPLNKKVAAEHAALVPGAATTVETLRASGVKIGSTTGYTRSIMEPVLPIAEAQGYKPDNLVCADDLPEGRPGPLGMYRCFIDLVVYPPSAVVKVDDTAPGIAEGVAAGCLTVGVALSGNYAGKTIDELAKLSDTEISKLRIEAAARLRQGGADHIIDTVADLPGLLETIER